MAHQKKQPHSQSGLIQNMKALCDSLMVLQMNRFFKDGVTSCKKSNLARQFLVLVESWLQSKSCPLLVQWIYNVQDPVGKPKSLDLSYFLARYSFCSWKCMWTMDKSGWKICREVNIEACGSLPHRKSLHSLHLQFLIQLVLSCLVILQALLVLIQLTEWQKKTGAWKYCERYKCKHEF